MTARRMYICSDAIKEYCDDLINDDDFNNGNADTDNATSDNQIQTLVTLRPVSQAFIYYGINGRCKL